MTPNPAAKLIKQISRKLRKGNFLDAKKLSLRLIDEHPETLEGWLFLAGLSDSIKDRQYYLSRAYQIAPDDPLVIKALAWGLEENQNDLPETIHSSTNGIKEQLPTSNQAQSSINNPHQGNKVSVRHKRLNWLNLIMGIILGVIGIWLIFLLITQYGPRSPQTAVSDDTLDRFQLTPNAINTDLPAAVASPTPITLTPAGEDTHTPMPTPTPTLTPSPTPEWMTYDGIDFRDQEIEALFTMACDQAQVYLDPFLVRPYSPELLDSGEFNTNLDFGMAWEHLGFHGLWIHSGQSVQLGDLAAYPLQVYLENNTQGFRRNATELSEHLQNCLIGSEMRLRQGDTISVNRVVAAVRIPPPEVEEVSLQPMNLVPYLAENYPDSGFDQMELPGLLFYFCGRNTSGEAFNSRLDYWTQSRFIIGFVPVDEV